MSPTAMQLHSVASYFKEGIISSEEKGLMKDAILQQTPS
jgi:hypothetical protein